VIQKIGRLTDTNFAVVGVAPAGFTGLVIGMQPDFWVPLAMTLTFTRDPHYFTDRNACGFSAPED
jgi:hypothetical protein